MSNFNIKTFEHSLFGWNDGDRNASLKSVYDEVLGKLGDSINWYQIKRVTKRKAAWSFRVAAIILGATAAALPTVTEMTRRTDGWLFRPGTATILGIMVGALLMLDRFLGASSSWIRFTIAETTLKELRDELPLAYSLEAAQWAGQNEPSIEQTKHALSVLQGFLSRANQTIHDETNQWKVEFQSALQQADEFSKMSPKKVEEAIGVVKITNPDRLGGPWTISINDGPEIDGTDDSKSFRLTPGPVTVRIKAVIKTNSPNRESRSYATEAAEVLITGSPKLIPITLPQN